MNKNITAVPVDTGETVHIETAAIPGYVAVDLAQSVFRAIHQAQRDPAIMEEYRKWKAERERAAV